MFKVLPLFPLLVITLGKLDHRALTIDEVSQEAKAEKRCCLIVVMGCRVQAMSKYLVEAGIDADRIIKDIWSLDTIGNAYFARCMVCEPRGFRRVRTLTSPFCPPNTFRLKLLSLRAKSPQKRSLWSGEK